MRVFLRVNPIACDGHGLCAELLPEVVGIDDWGYPIVETGPVPAHLVGHARRAVSACPKLALFLAGEARGRPRAPYGPVTAQTGTTEEAE